MPKLEIVFGFSDTTTLILRIHSMLRQDLNKKSKARELKFLKI
jgi:hypothetical protein